MKKLLLLIAFIILQSCNSVDTIEGNKIDHKLRSSINGKNDSLITAMNTSNLRIYFELESDEYRKKRQTSSTFKPSTIFKRGILKSNFTVYDEFYVTNSARYTSTGLKSEKHGYTFTFTNDKEQSYVSVLKLSGYQFDSLLAVTYGLTDDGWKIYDIDLFNLGNWGMTLNDYYSMAKKNEAKGYIINAYTFARNASELAVNKEDSKLQWDNSKEIKQYAQGLEDKIKDEYTFPLVMQKVPTKPTILSIEPRAILNSIVPTVNYHTVINLRDTVQLKQEKDIMKHEMKSLFKDFNLKTTVVFRAYQDTKGNGQNYYFIDKK